MLALVKGARLRQVSSRQLWRDIAQADLQNPKLRGFISFRVLGKGLGLSPKPWVRA